jgi:hypothetical protein
MTGAGTGRDEPAQTSEALAGGRAVQAVRVRARQAGRQRRALQG